jgi:dTDP-4-dehydrorhamnose reductase
VRSYPVDAYQTRLPTSVASVSLILLQLVESYPLSKPLPSSLPPILHFSSKAPLTKYDMCEIISRSLYAAGKDGSMKHILEDKEEPKNAVAQRPKDTTLDVGCLEEWGLEWADEEGGFEAWWKEWVQKL